MKQPTLLVKIALGFFTILVAFFAFMMTMVLLHSTKPQSLVGEKILCGVALLITSLLLFFALYQIYRLLKLIDKELAFSIHSLKIVQRIKVTLFMMFPVLLGLLPIAYRAADAKDAPGLVLIALGITSIPLIAAAFVATIEKLLRNAISIKDENDLTV